MLVALLALPAASAIDPYVVLLDWQEGHALVGTTKLAPSPVASRYAFEAGPCHRNLLLDLLYDPQELAVEVEGVGEAALVYDFFAELRRGDALVGTYRVPTPGYGHRLGLIQTPGPHELTLWLANGADVSWDIRVRGREVPGELACEPRVVVNEVEANPSGPDAGSEWVELYNADAGETVDVSLWTLRTTHGATSDWTLPGDTVLPPGGRLKILFGGGQFLDNVDESVILVDAFGLQRDATPMLTDGEDDARTWQRAPDGGADWVFAAATPP